MGRTELTRNVALFDTDRTLINIESAVNEALGVSTEQHFGYATDLRDLRRDQYAGQPMDAIFYSLAAGDSGVEGSWPDEVNVDDAIATYEEALDYILSNEPEPKRFLCDGVVEFLDRLKEGGIHLGVFSGATGPAHAKALEVTGLAGYFPARATSDEQNSIYRVDLIRLCASRLEKYLRSQGGERINPAKVAIFDDNPQALRAANQFCPWSIGVLSASLYTKDELEEAQPFKIYLDFRDPYIFSEVFE